MMSTADELWKEAEYWGKEGYFVARIRAAVEATIKEKLAEHARVTHDHLGPEPTIEEAK